MPPQRRRARRALQRVRRSRTLGSMSSRSASASASAGVNSSSNARDAGSTTSARRIEEDRTHGRHRRCDGSRHVVGAECDIVVTRERVRGRFDNGDVSRRRQRREDSRLHAPDRIATTGRQERGIGTGEPDRNAPLPVERAHVGSCRISRWSDDDRPYVSLHQEREIARQRRRLVERRTVDAEHERPPGEATFHQSMFTLRGSCPRAGGGVGSDVNGAPPIHVLNRIDRAAFEPAQYAFDCHVDQFR